MLDSLAALRIKLEKKSVDSPQATPSGAAKPDSPPLLVDVGANLTNFRCEEEKGGRDEGGKRREGGEEKGGRGREGREGKRREGGMRGGKRREGGMRGGREGREGKRREEGEEKGGRGREGREG